MRRNRANRIRLIGILPFGLVVLIISVLFTAPMYGADWTPAEIETAAWYDADDAATVLTSGNSVTNWLDKSGNSNHATQTTATLQPTNGIRTLNTLNILKFDGTDDRLALPQLGLDDGAIVFAVFEVDDNDDKYTVVASQAQGLDKYLGQTNPNLFVSPSRMPDMAAGMPTTGAHLYSKSALVVSNSYQYYLDGTKTAEAATDTRTFDGNQLIFIGGTGEGNFTADPRFHLDGTIGEVIILDERPDDATRQKVEGYLAWKWGLQGNLPSDPEHPYKNAAPQLPPSAGTVFVFQ